MNYLGIDIGGTAVKYGIVSADGTLLCEEQYEVAFDGYQTPILDTVLKTSQTFLQSYGIAPCDLNGIGVSATGQIDSVRGVVAGVGGNIINWKDAPIKQALEAQYKLPVTVVNDANCVALGEQWIGAAKGCKNVIVITVGTGLGGGIIMDGQVLLGQAGYAGELGHFSIAKDGRECTCGNKGCYEQYASMTALIRSVREQMPLQELPQLKKEEVNGKLIFELVEKGDDQITSIVEAWIQDIAVGLVSLTHIFNPELILIGGAVSTQETLFIEKVRKKVCALTMANFGENLRIERASLGNHAGLIGAVSYFIQKGEVD